MTSQRYASGQRREEIILAALEILDKQGLSELTLRALGRRIGISEAAIYRHFANKEQIMEQVAARVFSGPRLQIESSGAACRDQLERIMFAQLTALQANPHYTAVIFQDEIFRAFPTVADMFARHQRLMTDEISAAVRRGQQQGDVNAAADPDVFAVLFIGAMRQLAAGWRASGCKGVLTKKAQPVFQQLLRLLL